MRALLLATLLTLLALRPAAAAPGDPFGGDDAGCVPPDKNTAKCENAVAKATGKALRCVLKCHSDLVNGKIGDEETCERGDPTKSCKAKFDKATDGASRINAVCPACLDAATRAQLFDAVETQVDQGNGSIYCDSSHGEAPWPGEDTGFLPPSVSSNAICGVAVDKALSKAAGCILTCHVKRAAEKVTDDPTEDTCETACKAKYDKLTGPSAKGISGCPSCLDATARSQQFDLLAAAAETQNGVFYCAGCPTTTTTTTTTTTSSTSTTTIPGQRCGDSILQGSEQCDPPGSGCTVAGNPGRCDPSCTCQPAVCGNHITEPGEQCDDGNLVPGDGCDASCQGELTVALNAAAGDLGTTDDDNSGPSAGAPVMAAVSTPNSGSLTIVVSSVTAGSPAGFQLIGKQVDVTAPDADPNFPLILTFQLDGSRIRAGENTETVHLFRNGVEVPACLGDANVAFPDPCVSARRLLPGGGLEITALSSSASRWIFGEGLCGNGVLDGPEACDPPGQQGACAPGQVCNSVCQCGPPCDCCSASPTQVSVVTQIASGTCGSVQNNGGAQIMSLACGGLYFGGAGVGIPLPVTTPDQTQFILDVAACDASNGRLDLRAASGGDTGSNRTCTKAGCLFGAPVPVTDPGSPSTSVCIVNRLSQDATGTAACDGRIATLNIPLSQQIYLNGDLLSGEPGIQPCPLCKAGVCEGGPNDGLPCTPGDSASLGSAFPTSQDCPPPNASIGSIPAGFALTTGTVTGTAVDQPSQPNVFCGFCGNATTNRFRNPPIPCASNSDCTGVTGFTACRQHTAGAFTSVDVARTITEVGAPAACLAGGTPQASTLVSAFCIPPSYDTLVDAAADLPAPGAVSFAATVQVTSTPTTTTTSTTIPTCSCPNGAPSTLAFTTVVGSGACGHLASDTSSNFYALACGGLYFGGAGIGIPMPAVVPDMTSVVMNTSCSGNTLSLSGTTPAQAGGNRCSGGTNHLNPCTVNADCPGGTCAFHQCSTSGCLFGAPMPVPNTTHFGSTTSTCFVNKVTSSASGTADCTTGSVSGLSLPIGSTIFLTGDLMPYRCSGGSKSGQGCSLTCIGGSSNGAACTVNADCPGGTCGNSSCVGGTCVNDSGRCVSNGNPCQSDSDCPSSTCETSACTAGPNAGKGCLGNADCPGGGACRTMIQACPICNPTTLVCNGGPNDGLACTPGNSIDDGSYPTSNDCPPPGAPIGTLPFAFTLDTGTITRTAIDLPDQPDVFCGYCKNKTFNTFKSPAVPCSSNATCAGVTGFTSCGQRTAGAFISDDVARTIVESGVPAGALTTGGPARPAKLVSVLCVPPIFNALADSAADLPGPGAVALPGLLRTQ